MFFKKIICCGITAALLTACAGREAHIVPAMQSGDDLLSCPQLIDAMVLNTKEIQGLIRERNGDIAGNAAATITGAFLIIPLFFLDTKNAASKEAKGMIRRNQVLAERYKLKNCTPPLASYTDNPIVLDYTVFNPESGTNKPSSSNK